MDAPRVIPCACSSIMVASFWEAIMAHPANPSEAVLSANPRRRDGRALGGGGGGGAIGGTMGCGGGGGGISDTLRAVARVRGRARGRARRAENMVSKGLWGDGGGLEAG